MGSIIGGAIGKVFRAAREASVQNIEHLKTEALLHPKLFRLLVTKATRSTEPGLLTKLAAQFRRISLIGGVQALDEAKRQARKVEAAQARPVKATVPAEAAFPLNSLFMPSQSSAPTQRNALLN